MQGWLNSAWNPLGILAIVMAIYITSYLSWRFIERPAQRFILDLGSGRRMQQSKQEIAVVSPDSLGESTE
jgi:peptidoglycan/LPS O-acetylase OafA/YrhL